MPQSKWAQITATGEHELRRGSWYRVVDDSDPDAVVLYVNREHIRVDRGCVELAAKRPMMWSVVRRDPGEFEADKVRGLDLGEIYGICPSCLSRASLKPEDTELQCPRCELEFNIDW